MTGIPYHQLDLSAYGAVRFFESYAFTQIEEDWSQVRSPSRTRRRLKQGIPNRNLRHWRVPMTEVFYMRETNTIVGHPETLRALRRKFGERKEVALARTDWQPWLFDSKIARKPEDLTIEKMNEMMNEIAEDLKRRRPVGPLGGEIGGPWW